MYKFCIYKTAIISEDNLDHEEFFRTEQEIYKRFRELFNNGTQHLIALQSADTDEKYSVIECCVNCKHLINHAINNRYGDVEHFCVDIGFFVNGIYKDRKKYRSFTPGGKELLCHYEMIGNESEVNYGEEN